MDQEKIGRFIAERRKKLGLTQKQLAEPLNVTDKTVSKWETGVRLPDAAMLPELSSVLQTDINELLAGEAFLAGGPSPEEYAQKAQHNLVGLVGELDEMGKRGRSQAIGTAAGILLAGAALVYLLLFSLRAGRVMDLVYLPTYYEANALILTQASAAGYSPKYFGVDGMDGILSVKGFDAALAEGVMLLTPFNADAEDERTKSFVSKYQEKYGDVPNQFAADAYDCVYAIYEALKDEEGVTGASASDLCDKLTAKFTGGSFTFTGLTGESMTWDDTGAVSKYPRGMYIENGAYVGMD